MRYYKPITPYLFIAPMIGGLLLFRIGPILASVVISFTRWDIISDPIWLGLGNYQELFADDTFWRISGNTLLFVIAFVPGTMILGMAMALLVNRKLRGIAFFRGLYFMPYITSMVAVAIAWNWIFSRRFGLLNNLLLSIFGVETLQTLFATDRVPPAWLSDYPFVIASIVIVSVWKAAGFQMMVFLAGLQSVPQTLIEAARIDGANGWQVFRHITLPLISPVTFFVLIISIIDAFRTFEVTFTMTQGGRLSSGSTLAYGIYQNAFLWDRMGYGSAMAVVLVLIISALTFINFAARRRWVAQDVY
ncbi:MAG: sugar ABC transporter permease [Chloroflexi bacterium]|nr:sugar ABC transporter permease [Chloroflexota bacterium]